MTLARYFAMAAQLSIIPKKLAANSSRTPGAAGRRVAGYCLSRRQAAMRYLLSAPRCEPRAF